MKKATFHFPGKQTNYFFNSDFKHIGKLIPAQSSFIITDENVFRLHRNKFSGFNTIIIKAGEKYKQQSAVDKIIIELIKRKADRHSFILGVGGGVVTDIAGYAAGIYMRGLKFGFAPTTVLAMTDASIGGKNGVDVGIYKNLAGLIRQPDFLFYDYSFLKTLPKKEWINGFAEIIKHACIKDSKMFRELEKECLETFQKDHLRLATLVERNAKLKTSVVIKDEFEQGDRKLLNFGHTLGHAIENTYNLSHGEAISLGMVAACQLSTKLSGLPETACQRVIALLKKYNLPVAMNYNRAKIMKILAMDKKKAGTEINFVLLKKIGEAVIKRLPLEQIEQLIND